VTLRVFFAGLSGFAGCMTGPAGTRIRVSFPERLREGPITPPGAETRGLKH